MPGDRKVEADRQRVTARYYGRVQGVGFRYTVQTLAERFALDGHVRNEPDGSVELVAEGPRGRVGSLLAEVEASRLARYIVNRTYQWEAPRHDAGGFFIQ
jgi:acylphosphatase